MTDTVNRRSDTVGLNEVTDRMTTSDLAEYLRCSVYKARRLMGGDIPANYDGKRWTAAKADVDTYLASTKTTGKHRRPKGQRGRGKSLGSAR